MREFADILEQCLRDMESGASSLDECLARHPGHAAQLEPLLRTVSRVRKGNEIRPTPVLKARARARLTLHMQSHPRNAVRSAFTFQRFAAGLIALLLAVLVTGTAYAQGALPGNALYGWKLASEKAWRMISPDSVQTDLLIANRRINEMNKTADDPGRRAQALEGYREVTTRLESELDKETLDRILPPIDSFDDLSGLFTPVPGSDEDKGKDKDKDKTKTPHGKDPKATPPSMPKNPTKQPKIIPTIEVPPPVN